jgi:hypothetical protein
MSSTAPATDQTFLERFWPHLTVVAGALAAIVLGAADHFWAKDAWGVGVDLSLIWAGLGALGVTATIAAVKN